MVFYTFFEFLFGYINHLELKFVVFPFKTSESYRINKIYGMFWDL